MKFSPKLLRIPSQSQSSHICPHHSYPILLAIIPALHVLYSQMSIMIIRQSHLQIGSNQHLPKSRRSHIHYIPKSQRPHRLCCGSLQSINCNTPWRPPLKVRPKSCPPCQHKLTVAFNCSAISGLTHKTACICLIPKNIMVPDKLQAV